MNRKDLLMENYFLNDKEHLVEQIILNEQKGILSLPTKFNYKQTSPFDINESLISILRIEDFFALEIETNHHKRYQLFENEISARKFFIEKCPDKSTRDFWLRRFELVCD